MRYGTLGLTRSARQRRGSHQRASNWSNWATLPSFWLQAGQLVTSPARSTAKEAPQFGHVKSICVLDFAAISGSRSVLHGVVSIQVVTIHQADELAGVRRVGCVAIAIDLHRELPRIVPGGH